MQKKAGIFLISLCLLVFSTKVFAQGVLDHLNNDVYYTVNSKCSFNFTSNLIGLTASFYYDSSEYLYSDANESHVTRARAFVVNVNLIDFNYNLNDFFTQSNQPTLSINFGHSFNSVSNFINWDELTKGQRRFLGSVDHDLYIGVFASKRFINYWDTVNHSFSDQTIENYNSNSLRDFNKFFNYGFKVDYNLYYTRWLAVAMTATIQHGNVKELASFQNVPLAYSAGNNVYGMNDLAGKVGGDVNDRQYNMRFSIGTPLFIRSIYRSVKQTDDKDKELGSGRKKAANTMHRFWGSLFVMPYYAPNGWVSNRWTNEVGTSINLLQTPYGGSNSKVATSEGIGVDWQSGMNTRNGWSGPIVYVTGKLNIGTSPEKGRIRRTENREKGTLLESAERTDTKDDK